MPINPYTHLGNPVRDPRQFIGRKQELTKLSDDVRNGQCVSVSGIRRIGKTSLLLQILDKKAKSRFHFTNDIVCIYVSCDRLGKMTFGELYTEIIQRIARQLEPNLKIELHLDTEKTATFKEFENHVYALRQAGYRLVLLLDEFERLAENPNLDIDFFLGLRSLHTEHEVTYVTASLKPLMELKFSQGEILSSPFPNIFDTIRVGLFPESEARQLIHKSGLFSIEVENYLYALAGGHPLALQHACHFAYGRHSQGIISSESLAEIAIQTVDSMSGHYRYYWNALSTDQKRILTAPSYFTQRQDDTRILNILKDLENMGMLVRNREDGFQYTSRALAEFIRQEATRDQDLRKLPIIDWSGSVIGQYQIIHRLGQGGMAEIYLARQVNLDRLVALKMMLPHLVADEGFSARFQREARLAAGLRHPNIVQVFDFGQQAGLWYIVMEYIQGESLKNRLQRLKSTDQEMSFDEAARIIEQIGEALQYAHERGLVHRDIKPSNVMLSDESHEAILTDFGLAKIVEGTPMTTSSVIGTPAYMAPEQFKDPAHVDQRADIYALGIMLYEMITGRLPFEANTPAALAFKHIQEPLPDPLELRVDLIPSLRNLIQKATAKEPQQRYQTIQELLCDLHRREQLAILPRQCWGVMVGVNHYHDPVISPLTECANDARLIFDALCETRGFNRGRMCLLSDEEPIQPTKNDILANLSAMAEAAEADDLVLFYFSGHGISEAGEGYLLPCDTRYSVLTETSISVKKVGEILAKSQAHVKIVILDACHSGAHIGKAALTMSDVFIEQVFEQAEGSAVFASCKQKQVSWEWPEKHQSVFTYYLLEGIRREADRDGKGFVTLFDLVRHVTQGVKLWAFQRSLVQTPTFQAQTAGDMILADYRRESKP